MKRTYPDILSRRLSIVESLLNVSTKTTVLHASQQQRNQNPVIHGARVKHETCCFELKILFWGIFAWFISLSQILFDVTPT